MSLMLTACRCCRTSLNPAKIICSTSSSNFSSSSTSSAAPLPSRDWSIPTSKSPTQAPLYPSPSSSKPSASPLYPPPRNSNAHGRRPPHGAPARWARPTDESPRSEQGREDRGSRNRSVPGPGRNGEGIEQKPRGFGLRTGASGHRSRDDPPHRRLDSHRGQPRSNPRERSSTARPGLSYQGTTRTGKNSSTNTQQAGDEEPSSELETEGNSRWQDEDDLPRARRVGKGDREVRASSSLIHRDDQVDPLSRRCAPKKKGKGREWDIDGGESPEVFKVKEVKKVKVKKVEAKGEKEVYIPSTISVGRLARTFDVSLFNLQKTMLRMDMSEDQRRADYLLNSEEACNLALEYDFDPVVDNDRAFDIYPDPSTDGTDQPLRPPVVTIMGHVDHGKTTLLDSLRHTSVAAHEAGGITQHIGAFSVPLTSLVPSSTSSGSITFLDTPGHAAFTAMRARGAHVTDIVVLVVAADDGVMPQTREVLELVKSEGEKVGLVVAINKCDKPGIDISKVKSALGAEGILLEEDGGETPSVKVSGLAKTGLDDLVETLSTLAEIRDLRARQEGKAEGFVLESRVDKGRGNVATVLMTRGTLRTGASIVAGTTWCRVRQMQDDKGRPLKEALPGMPLTLTGWKDLPTAGDELLEATNEDEAKKAITNRKREQERKKLLSDVEQINIKRKIQREQLEKEAEEAEAVKAAGGNVAQAHNALVKAAEKEEELHGYKELRLVIKGDVSGTVEAVVGSLEGIGNKLAGVKVIHTGVGDVSESDVTLAAASEATVIGFSVTAPRSIQTQATSFNVPLHLESVIYRLIEKVRSDVISLLPVKYETRVTGTASINEIFTIKIKGSKDGMVVAGCRVSNGVISKAEKVRVTRAVDNSGAGGGDGQKREVVWEGSIDNLKHLKKDVGEVRKGTECGISFHGFKDLKAGDEVVSFTTFEVAREL